MSSISPSYNIRPPEQRSSVVPPSASPGGLSVPFDLSATVSAAPSNPPVVLATSSSSSCDTHGQVPGEWNVSVMPTAADLNQKQQNSTNSARSRAALLMQIRTQTWLADSHGLFDYESRNVLSNEFKCTCLRESYYVCRLGSEIRFLPEDEATALYEVDTRVKPLVQILWANGCYNLVAPSPRLQPDENDGLRDEHLWLVVRHLQDRCVVVTQGDLLKLGRFRLRVKETVMSPQEAKTTLRFLGHDDDDCETVAPEPGDSAVELDVPDQPVPSVPAVSTYELQPPSGAPSDTTAAIQEYIPTQESPGERTPGSTRDKAVTPPQQLVHQRTNYPRICRICLCEADEGDHIGYNPLVAPCECKGSMRWVHLQCLRTWMAGRLNIRNDGHMVSFFWRTLECELCRITYPPVVRVRESGGTSDDDDDDDDDDDSSSNPAHGDLKKSCSKDDGSAWKTMELFEIPRPDIPYAILEPRSQQNRGLHIVSLANNKMARLGRGHESDIRLADISVSRLHSVLRFQQPPIGKRLPNSSIIGSSGIGHAANDTSNGCFIAEDNRSKFGTLLELRKPFRLEPNCPAISVQAGRTVVTISLKRRWRLRIPACIRQNSTDIYVVLRQQQQQQQHPTAQAAMEHRLDEEAEDICPQSRVGSGPAATVVLEVAAPVTVDVPINAVEPSEDRNTYNNLIEDNHDHRNVSDNISPRESG